MGLDMYLTRKTYVKNWEHAKETKHEVIVKTNNKLRTDIDPKRVSYIIEDVAYWRKANHIHSWFVENVQEGTDDCGDYYASAGKLQELLDLCIEVSKNPSKGPDLLPTSAGFFFGDTEYGEYYIADIEETIRMLNPLLAKDDDAFIEENKSYEYYYHSSW